MAPRAFPVALVALLLALPGCGDDGPKGEGTPASGGDAPRPSAPAPPPTRLPTPDPRTRGLLRELVPPGVPTTANGERADPRQLRVVQRWLAALTQGDIPAAADTFADGAVVQNLRPPVRLATRELRLGFNASFPCGAELSTASSVRGYLVVTYRLTDRRGSPCDGPGGTAAGTIKVEGGRMTEWYRLPNPPDAGVEPGGVV